MKLNKNKNIIFDSDIISTGLHLGETLDVALEEHEKDISELKRNVKFLYLYGGIGAKGGGGSGGTSGEWNIYATLDRVLIVQGNYISLDGPKFYNLQIKINKPAGLSYRVLYSYRNSYGTQESLPQTLNLDNLYTLNASIYLDLNDGIVVTVASEDGDTKQVSSNFIVEPYVFNLYLADNEGQKYSLVNNDLFITDIQQRKLFAYLEYDVGIVGNVYYEYNNFLREHSNREQIDLSESNSGILKLPVAQDSFFTNDNSGLFTFDIDIEIQPENQTSKHITRVINCNLIPSTLYLKLVPLLEDAIIYDEIEQSPYGFQLGYNSFILLVFEGQNGGRTYSINTYLSHISGGVESEPIPIGETFYITERESKTETYIFSTSGWNKITFKINGTNYEVSKYIYITSSTLNLLWEYFSSNEHLLEQHYINSSDRNLDTSYNCFSQRSALVLTLSSTQKTISFSKLTNADALDALISIAIQYGAVNDVDSPMIEISNNNGNKLEIYLDKITTLGTDISIYINKYELLSESTIGYYNLITIYRKFCKKIDNDYYYEFLVYVDGILAGCLGQFDSIEPFYNIIKFNKGNYICNLIDIKYYKRNTEGIFKDSDISRYYYTYLYKYGGIQDLEKLDMLMKINQVASNFVIDTELDGVNTGMVSLSDDGVLSNLANILGVAPILLMDVSDIQEGTSIYNKFLNWYLARIGENDKDETGSFRVTLKYKPEDATGFIDIDTPEGALFYIKKQGTSTKQYFAKNLDLELRSNNEEYDYLYTPNLELEESGDSNLEIKRKNNTFLPEQKFTLKKDVVDSGHSNNNAIADFVNANTAKFETGENEHHLYRYVKNCLTGFPCLVFVNVKHNDNLSKIYYLGIYNFNLGRESYYNLGYKSLYNLDTLDKELSNGFKIYKISSRTNTFKQGILVAEVLNNGPYYDFAQYDDSILFGNFEEGGDHDDGIRMFGDLVPDNNIKPKIKEFVRSISLAGGFIFELLRKTFGSPDEKYQAAIENDGVFVSSKNLVPVYKTLYRRFLDENTGKYVYGIRETSSFDNNINSLRNAIAGTEEIAPTLDYTSCVLYYVIIMALGMVDSIEKNLNIKSWNGGTTYSVAFYDMDTGLGLDNVGAVISYFAFSDYWSLVESDLLVKALVYRDFFPLMFYNSSLKGYDIPSSYLFAIAKYGKLMMDTFNQDFDETFPLLYWANLRRENGELRNSEYFVNTYYANRMNKIGESLLNLNYRATYLIKPPQINVNNLKFLEDYKKFHGYRKNYVKAWLNERLHILDVYMGLISSSNTKRYIQYLDSQTNAWKVVYSNLVPLTEPEISEKPIGNSDVIIYKDIFGTEARGYSHKIAVNIKALENSFVAIVIPNEETTQYMIKEPDKSYLLVIEPTGNNKIIIGGSDRWTYISDLAPFISDSSSFSVDSNNLQNFYLSPSGALAGTISGRMPAVTSIDIHGNNYTCNLTNVSSIFPNVLSIDLSESKVSLNLENSRLNELNLQGINTNNVTITNCNFLNTINLANLLKGNTTIYTTISNELKITPYYGDLNLNGVKIKKITVTAANSNSTVTIIDNPILEELRLSNFREVNISNCPKLHKIIIGLETETLGVVIGQGEPLQKLTITGNCGDQTSNTLQINSNYNSDNNTGYYINLSLCTNLSLVNFSNTKNFPDKIKLPDGCRLLSNCFLGTNIEQIDCDNNGYVFINGTNVFQRSAIRDISRVKVDASVTSLANTFNAISSSHSKNLVLSLIVTFINNIDENNNNITNINSLFAGQTNIKYTVNSNTISEYTNETCSINLSKFRKVTSATNLFASTGVSFLNKYMFKDLGSQNYVDLSGIFKWNTNLYCTIDSLEYIIPKIEKDLMITTGSPTGSSGTLGSGNTATITFVDSSGNSYSNTKDVKIRDFLMVDTPHVGRIKGLYGLRFSNTLKYDYEGLFTNSNGTAGVWDNLEIICYCFNNIEVNNFRSLGTNTILNLKYVYNSFNDLILTDYLNLYESFNWDKFNINISPSNKILNTLMLNYRIENMLFYKSLTSKSPEERTAIKYITKENYDNLWRNINCLYYTKIGNLFEDTLLIASHNNDINLPEFNPNVLETLYTFLRFKIVNVLVTNNTNFDNLSENNILDLNLDDIISNLKNCQIFYGTFAETELYKSLPYNFFKRRKENIYSDVFIADSDEDLNQDHYDIGNYIYYTYNLDISDLTKCFYKTKINNNRWFDPLSHQNEILDNRLEINGQLVTGRKYTKNKLTSLQDVTKALELLDSENVIVSHFYTNSYLVYSNNIYIYTERINSLENRDYNNYFFVAPDLLYGCNANCNMTQCFAESNFAGALPKHLIETIESGNLTDWLFKTNVLPLFVGTYKQQDNILFGNNSIYKDVYTFVPELFGVKRIDFSNAFTFYARIPERFNLVNEDSKIMAYYIFLDSTFNQLNTLENSLPICTPYWERNGTTIVHNSLEYLSRFYENQGNIYYNIMFNTHNISTIENDEITLYEAGIDGISFPNMKVDNLFDGYYLNMGFGYLFEDRNKTLTSYNRNSSDNKILKFNGNISRLPLNIILPLASTNSSVNMYSYIEVRLTEEGWSPTVLSKSRILGNSNLKDLYNFRSIILKD